MTQTDVFILGILLGGVLYWFISRRMRSLRLQKKLKAARKGEQKALKLLQNHGFKVVAAQEQKKIVTYVNDRPYENVIRADFIVKKLGKTYIAEVKTGNMAKRPTSPEIRRQLLEYYLAYQPSGLLLVDMDKGRIQTISFTITGFRERQWQRLALFLLTAFLGLVCGWFIYKFAYCGGNAL